MNGLGEALEVFKKIKDATSGEEILNALAGVSFDAFILLDEKPGMFDDQYTQHQWHRLMRHERNHIDSPLINNLKPRYGG